MYPIEIGYEYVITPAPGIKDRDVARVVAGSLNLPRPLVVKSNDNASKQFPEIVTIIERPILAGFLGASVSRLVATVKEEYGDPEQPFYLGPRGRLGRFWIFFEGRTDPSLVEQIEKQLQVSPKPLLAKLASLSSRLMSKLLGSEQRVEM